MSDAETGEVPVADRLVDLLVELGKRIAALKTSIVEGDDEPEILDTADDLWDVLDETEDLLETIDFEEVPDVIDFEDLPETVDVENVPEGVLDEDEEAIELETVREAINLRELWDAADLTELREEKQDLEDAVDDVTENGDGAGDDELIEVGDVVGTGQGANVEFDAEDRQAAIQDTIENAVEKFRSLLLETHDKLRVLYEANQQKLGQPGRQPDSRNPTAASTLPPGPIPDSASTRASTVPSEVRYSNVDNPRRIYGRRFEEGETDE